MRPFGLLLIAVFLLLPLVFFVPLAGRNDPIAVFSQYLGSAALIAMGISQILATRWRGLETVFGGLDRIYVIHKWLGIGALAAILLHDTIDAEMRGLGRETVLVELAETLGEISLYGILALVVITIVTFVPYHLWRWTHRFMGAFFAMSAFHFAFILKPFPLSDPLGLYILAFCLFGIVAYLYTLLPDRAVHLPYRYAIAGLEESGEALAVTLKPRDRGVRHEAGQFAFVRFDHAELGEIHPFTISKAPEDDRTIRFTIKPLGDYTRRLKPALKVGMDADISRAYGHFRFHQGSDPQIWIAGGIGVTPFVAWAQALAEDGGPVHFFYCVKSRSAAAHLSELENIAGAHANLTLHLISSELGERLTGQEVQSRSGVDLGKARVWFCGPKPMRKALRRELIGLGLPSGKFLVEEFEIRSGIGLRGLLIWLLRRFFAGRIRALEPVPAEASGRR